MYSIVVPRYQNTSIFRGDILQSIEIGNQTVKGIKLVELFAESMTQFIFTCYIMAEFGLDLEKKDG